MLLISSSLFGQDLFDKTHSKQYADFLFQSGNYSEALQEYERILFSFDTTEATKLRLIQTYRLAGYPLKALIRMRALWEEPGNVSGPVSWEYLSLQIINNEFEGFEPATRNDPFLTHSEKSFLLVASLLFRNDFTGANTLLDTMQQETFTPTMAAFRHIATDAINRPQKSPFIGGFISFIIPGSGKMYAGNWEDGFISLGIVGVSAWQAYRGFNTHGSSSAYGWIYAIIGTAFYAGNIYGSIREVHRFNFLENNRVRKSVEAIFYNRL